MPKVWRFNDEGIKMNEGKSKELEGSPKGAFAPMTLEEATHIKVYTDVGMLGLINIGAVNPYNLSHYPFGDKRWRGVEAAHKGNKEATEENHRRGVEHMKKGLKEGKIIRPILVFNGFRRQDMEDFEDVIDWSKVRYHRLDGFKRYMALKEMGVKWIAVHVVNTWIEGGQSNQPWHL